MNENEDIFNCSDSQDSLETKKPKNKKPKEKSKRLFKRDKSTEKDDSPLTEQVSNTWNVLTEQTLTESQVPDEVEDIVDTHERVIGKRIKTELNINEARGMELSIRDRIELTKKYLTKDEEERKRLEEYRSQEEKRTNHVITLRNFLLTELSVHLTDTQHELVVNIDAKFGPYIEEAMREIELGYFIKEIPRNADLVILNPSLPYKYAFMVKAI